MKLGNDGNSDLCMDAAGRIWAVDPDRQAPDRYVNASAELFDHSLELFIPVWQQTGQVDEEDADALVDWIAGQLEGIDPTVFGDDENWWAVIFEQLRAGLI